MYRKINTGEPPRKFLCFFGLMVFNAAFNNISVISWRSVFLVEDPEKTTNLSQVLTNSIMFI